MDNSFSKVKYIREDLEALGIDPYIVSKYKKNKAKINKAIKYINHELNGHILIGDEESWNDEFYIDGILDYKKLCISLLSDVRCILKGSDK